MVVKTCQKSLELPLSWKVVNQKQYYISGGIAEIHVITNDLKDIGMVFSAIFLFNFPIKSAQKTKSFWKITVIIMHLTKW
jgi:hypothetical protein